MNKNEFNSVVKISAAKRYVYFIKKVVDFEEIWGLYNEGWATTEDDKGRILIPFWPKKEFAEACAIGEWGNYKPIAIGLDEFIEKWLPGMKEDGNLPSIFWNNIDSTVVENDILKRDIENELENY